MVQQAVLSTSPASASFAQHARKFRAEVRGRAGEGRDEWFGAGLNRHVKLKADLAGDRKHSVNFLVFSFSLSASMLPVFIHVCK